MKMRLEYGKAFQLRSPGMPRALGDSSCRSVWKHLFYHCFHIDDLTRLALSSNFERTAANFAIRREFLAAQAGVNDHFTVLTAIGTLDIDEFFHAAI